MNPSFDNVTDIKWSSILRLRAVENRFFSLCTLHCDVTRNRTHPFAYTPDGTELSARQAGSEVIRPLSECCEAGSIYVVELDMAAVGKPLDWSKIPSAKKPKRPRNGEPLRPIHVELREGQPAGRGDSGWNTTDSGFRIASVHGPVYVGVVPSERILDAAACFQVLDRAKQANCAPIIWNHWERLPADSARLGNPHDGKSDRVLRTDREFGWRRYPRTGGVGKQVEDSRAEGHGVVQRSDRRYWTRVGTGQCVQDGHQTSSGRHGGNRIGSLSES